MTATVPPFVTEAFERLLAERPQEKYVLRLYVSVMSPCSLAAMAALKDLCERLIPGRYELEIINLRDHPEQAEAKQILAAPTLVRELPLPVRRLVGDLTNTDRVMLILR